MSAVGKVNSYANIQPVNDPLAGAITFADDVFARKRKEDADKAEKQRLAAEKKQLADSKDLDLKGEFTGYGTPDGAIMAGLRKAADAVANAQRDRDSGKMSATDYKIFVQNVKTNMDYMNNKAKNINSQASSYAEMIKKGEVFTPFTENAMRFGGALEKGQFDVEIDPRGNFNYKLFDKDENTGETSIIEKGNILEFGNESFTPVRNYNLDQDLELFKKNNPRQKTETPNGMLMTTVTDIGENTKANIKSHVKGLISNPDILSQAYYLSGGGAERNITDPAKIKQAEDYLVQKYTNSYVKDVELDVDVQRQRLAMDKKKAEEDKIKTTTFKFDSPRTDDFLSDKTPGKKVDPKTVYNNGISFDKPAKISNLGGANSDLNMVEVYGVTKDKKTGDLIFTGKALKTKNAKFKVGGKLLDFNMVKKEADAGNEEAKAALDSYGVANNYGNFIRRVTNQEEANAVLLQAGYDVNSAKSELEKLNPDAKKETAPNSQEEFNAKWAKLKSGESLLAPDGNTYTKK